MQQKFLNKRIIARTVAIHAKIASKRSIAKTRVFFNNFSLFVSKLQNIQKN